MTSISLDKHRPFFYRVYSKKLLTVLANGEESNFH